MPAPDCGETLRSWAASDPSPPFAGGAAWQERAVQQEQARADALLCSYGNAFFKVVVPPVSHAAWPGPG